MLRVGVWLYVTHVYHSYHIQSGFSMALWLKVLRMLHSSILRMLYGSKFLEWVRESYALVDTCVWFCCVQCTLCMYNGCYSPSFRSITVWCVIGYSWLHCTVLHTPIYKQFHSSQDDTYIDTSTISFLVRMMLISICT